MMEIYFSTALDSQPTVSRSSRNLPKVRRARVFAWTATVATLILPSPVGAQTIDGRVIESQSSPQASVATQRIYMPAYIPGSRPKAIVFGGIESYKSPASTSSASHSSVSAPTAQSLRPSNTQMHTPVIATGSDVADWHGRTQAASTPTLNAQTKNLQPAGRTSDSGTAIVDRIRLPQGATNQSLPTPPRPKLRKLQGLASTGAVQVQQVKPAASQAQKGRDLRPVELKPNGFVPRTGAEQGSTANELAPNAEATLQRDRSQTADDRRTREELPNAVRPTQENRSNRPNNDRRPTTGDRPSEDRRPTWSGRGPVYDGLPRRGAPNSRRPDAPRDLGPGHDSGRVSRPGDMTPPHSDHNRVPRHTLDAENVEVDVRITMDDVLENKSVQRLLELMEENVELKAGMKLQEAKLGMKNELLSRDLKRTFQELEKVRSEYKKLREKAQKAVDDQKRIQADLEQEIRKLKSHIAELELRLEAQQEREQQLREEAESSRLNGEEVERHSRAELRELDEQNNRLQREIEELRHAFEVAKDESAKPDGEAQRLRDELAELEHQLSKRTGQLSEKSAQVEDLQAAIEKYQAKKNASKSGDRQSDEHERKTTELKKALDKERSVADSVRKKCELLQKENVALKHKLDSLTSEFKKQAAEAKKKRDAATRKLESDLEQKYRNQLERELATQFLKVKEDATKQKSELEHRTRVLEEKLKSTEKKLAKAASELASANKKLAAQKKSESKKRSVKKRKSDDKRKSHKDDD